MTLSDGVGIVCALMDKARKFINKKPEEYRPIYHMYYMAIYVALQDSFDYGKTRGKVKNKADFKWRNGKKAKLREEAREWLLKSDSFPIYWEIVSDIDCSVFREALVLAFRSFSTSVVDKPNERNRLANEVSARLTGLSI